MKVATVMDPPTAQAQGKTSRVQRRLTRLDPRPAGAMAKNFYSLEAIRRMWGADDKRWLSVGGSLLRTPEVSDVARDLLSRSMLSRLYRLTVENYFVHYFVETSDDRTPPVNAGDDPHGSHRAGQGDSSHSKVAKPFEVYAKYASGDGDGDDPPPPSESSPGLDNLPITEKWIGKVMAREANIAWVSILDGPGSSEPEWVAYDLNEFVFSESKTPELDKKKLLAGNPFRCIVRAGNPPGASGHVVVLSFELLKQGSAPHDEKALRLAAENAEELDSLDAAKGR